MRTLQPLLREAEDFPDREQACFALYPPSGHVDSRSAQFLTHDVDECRDYFRAQRLQFHVQHRLDFQSFRHREWVVGCVALSLLEIRCAGEFTLVKTQAASCYEFKFPQEGICRARGHFGKVEVKPGGAFIVDPDQCVTESWVDRMSQFVLRVDHEAIEGVLGSDCSRKAKNRLAFAPYSFDPRVPVSLGVIANMLSQSENEIVADRRVTKSIEGVLVTIVLTAFRHSESDGLWRSGQGDAPYYVKRAEDYVHANARDAISIEDLASYAKVSARTLFYGFSKWRGKTPMAYIRDARLDMAKRELEKARSAGGSVSQAAINCGFSNFSQFSRVYKDRFGVRPSVTLRGN